MLTRELLFYIIDSSGVATNLENMEDSGNLTD